MVSVNPSSTRVPHERSVYVQKTCSVFFHLPKTLVRWGSTRLSPSLPLLLFKCLFPSWFLFTKTKDLGNSLGDIFAYYPHCAHFLDDWLLSWKSIYLGYLTFDKCCIKLALFLTWVHLSQLYITTCNTVDAASCLLIWNSQSPSI